MNHATSSPPRIFVLGTDTEVGKTQISCALLRAARRHGVRVLPFKPAQSGTDTPTDAQRLCDAAAVSLTPDDIAPLRYEPPVAPGVAHDVRPFLDPDAPVDNGPLETVLSHLRALEQRVQPDWTLIEGAGGLDVPMPGGTWQPAWIEAFNARALLVTRPNLGTLNHTSLTARALRAAPYETLGLIVNNVPPEPLRTDASLETNLSLLARIPGVPCLGRFPSLGAPTRCADDLDAEDALFTAVSELL